MPTRDLLIAASSDRVSGSGLLLPFAGLIAALTILRLAVNGLSGTDLFVDEAQYWDWSRALALGYYSKPPLLAWLIAGATHVCGDSEFCVRLPSPLLHAATSFVVFLIGRRLYCETVGFWSGLAFALLPGVSLSAGIISTDVPLLFFWAVGVLAFLGLMERPSAGLALLLALALGLGLNAKYAMAYFLPCAGVALMWRQARPTAGSLVLLGAAVLGGLALLIPNVLWNAQHGYATFAHTADNAGWHGIPFHPGKAAEFLVTQFGVFGPILFGVLLVTVWRAARGEVALSDADRSMLAFSLPVLAAVTVQGFLSHALANWAAPAYVTATVLVTAELLRRDAWGWLKGSLAVSLAILALIASASIGAGHFTLPGAGDPFARTLGQRGLADAVRNALAEERKSGTPVAGVLTDARGVTAGLLYYGRDLDVPVWAWRSGAVPQNHFEMVRGFPGDVQGAVLLVSLDADPRAITRRFGSVTPLGSRAVRAGDFTTRTLHLFRLASFKGAPS